MKLGRNTLCEWTLDIPEKFSRSEIKDKGHNQRSAVMAEACTFRRRGLLDSQYAE